VVIPAFNAGASLGRAIRSALHQTLPPAEILVIDDGSADGTFQIAESFGSPVRVLYQRRAGAAAARNTGIAASIAPLIAFLDADDEWLPWRLQRQLPLHCRGLAFSFCGSHEVDGTGRRLGDTFAEWCPVRGSEAWRTLLARNFVATPTVIADRRVLARAGGFDSRLKVGEDQDMWIRLALLGPVDFVRDDLVRVHVRPGSLSNSRFEDELDYTWPMIQRHLENLSDRLSAAELRCIRGERLGKMGRTAYAQGRAALGAQLVWQALFLRNRPWRNAYHLAAASPPAKRLRRWLGRPGEVASMETKQAGGV
jgi:glycosyltransferase involved in cell wall biosynthesis